MGKLLDSILSGSSGKVGRVVVANLYGNEILRSRSRRRKAEPTAKQLLVQSRMKKSYDFILPYKEFAKRWFGQRVGLKSPYNMAMTNVLDAFKLDFILMKITPVYSEIEFARGSLLSAIPTGLTSPTPLSFTLTWFDNSGGDPFREDDQLQLLYIAEDDAKPVFIENSALRADATVTINLPPNFLAKTVHVWLAFQSDAPQLVSFSVYVGSIVIT